MFDDSNLLFSTIIIIKFAGNEFILQGFMS